MLLLSLSLFSQYHSSSQPSYITQCPARASTLQKRRFRSRPTSMGPTRLITFLTTQGWLVEAQLKCQLRGDLLPGHSLHWGRRPLYSAVSLRRIHGSGIKGYEQDNPVLQIMLSVPVMLDSSGLEALKKEHFYQGTPPVVTVSLVLWARREVCWFPRFAITNHHIGEGLKIHRHLFSGSSGVWTSKIRVLSNQQGLAPSEAQRKKTLLASSYLLMAP